MAVHEQSFIDCESWLSSPSSVSEMALLFEETEAGKPRSWNCLISSIIIITLMNVSIVVLIRVLLTLEDDIDEPIIKGQAREDLLIFLGFFTLTFFFGCCCCFCGGGLFIQWLLLCPFVFCSSLSALAQRFITSHGAMRGMERMEDSEEVVDLSIVMASHSLRQTPPTTGRFLRTDTQPFEGVPSPLKMIESEACPERSPVGFPRRSRAFSIDVGLR